MATRRVVTGIEDGRSKVLSDGAAPLMEGTGFEELWIIGADDNFGHSPIPGEGTLEGAPGSTKWRVVTIPTEEQYRQFLERLPEDLRTKDRAEGWHTTSTVDLVFVLEGEVTLNLDDDEVLLYPGDVVVQQGTKHAWHCRGEAPVRLLALMRTFPESSAP